MIVLERKFEALSNEMESYCDIAADHRFTHPRIRSQQIFAEDHKTTTIPCQAYVISNKWFIVGLCLYTVTCFPDKAHLSQCLKITSYFYAPDKR